MISYSMLYNRLWWGSSTSLELTQIHSFLWVSNIPLCVCVHHNCLSIPLSMDIQVASMSGLWTVMQWTLGYLCLCELCFSWGAHVSVNYAFLGVHVSLWTMLFSGCTCLCELFFSGYMPSSGTVGSYGSFVSRFLRNLHTVLHSSCALCFE